MKNFKFLTTVKWTFPATGETFKTHVDHNTLNGGQRRFNKFNDNPSFSNVTAVTKNTRNETVMTKGF